jgi:hypothetical protein
MFPIICLYWQIEAINRCIKRYKLSKGAIYGWLSYYGELVKPHEDSNLRGHPLHIPSENKESLSGIQFKEYYSRQRLLYQIQQIPNSANKEFYIQQLLEERSAEAEETLERMIQYSLGKHIYRTSFGFLNEFCFVEFNQLEIPIRLGRGFFH